MILTLTLSPGLDKTYVIEGLAGDRLNYAVKSPVLPGSKGINVSRMLQCLGVPNIACGLCGGDLGNLLKQLLTKENVAHDFVETEADIRLNVKIADIKNKTFTDVNEYGEPVSDKELEALIRLYKSYLPKISHVVIGGSARMGMKDDVYNNFIDMANEHGKKVLLDCSGNALRSAVSAKPFLISPNIHELREYSGKNLKTSREIITVLKAIHKGGIPYAVVTLGAKGAILVCDKGVYKMMVPKVNAVNTTGAGDSFLAGLLYGLTQDSDIISMLKYAGSFSSVKVKRFDTAMPSLIEAFSLIEQVEVEKTE